MASFFPEYDLCTCGHIRGLHEADADFNGERYVGEWGTCEVNSCQCERFEDTGETLPAVSAKV